MYSYKKLDSLQCFRGLAALSVALFHATATTNPLALGGVGHFGFLGVDFFFVLSGFIILNSHFDDHKTIAALKNYYIKRIIRIYPPFWPISIGMILIYFYIPNLSNNPSGTHNNFSFLSSILLLPDTTGPALNVAWTLIYEILFYLIFTIYFISGRIFFIFIVSWVIVIFANIYLTGLPQNSYDTPSNWSTHLISPINLEFILGMITAYLTKKIPRQFGMPIFLLGLLSFILFLFWPFALVFRPLFALTFAIIVLGSVLLEWQGKLKSPQWLIKLGDASYSIYLVHNPLISVSNRLTAHSFGSTNYTLAILAGILFSIFVGYLYHLIVEKPLTKFFHKKLTITHNYIH
jgi:exopolysaccharide production protein ExoZ